MRISFAGLSGNARPLRVGFSPVWFLAAGIAFFILMTSPMGCGDDGGTKAKIRHPQDFLPPATEAMQKNGPPRTATDTADLQDIVKDGYEVYTNNGFVEMVEQLYQGTVGQESAAIKIWIFDMGTAKNAESLHDELLQKGSWEEWNELGDEDHRQTKLLGFVILFRLDKYSVELEIDSKSQEAEDLLVLFATHIDYEIRE